MLAFANVVNIGADLAGMAEATELVTGVDSLVWTPIYAVLIVSLLFWSTYLRIARIFKWLTLILFAYVAAAFLARPDWSAVARSTFIPHVEWSRQYLATFVGIIGTTISPYLFFWQASQEVEEERAKGRRSVAERRGATAEELRASLRDVLTGMFFANLVWYFIILTTAATLHAHGQTRISTAQQAAEALRPFAGKAAYLLFTLGLVGTGMLAVPVLAGACAYAIAEALAWRARLDDRPPLSGKFYTVVGVAMTLGLVLDYAGFNAVSMLFWSAVVNGVLAPPLIVVIVLANNNPRVMGDLVTGRFVRALGWIAAGIMSLAALAMFLSP
jgi:Mn2+/Fe2+ NRAMP family transporter